MSERNEFEKRAQESYDAGFWSGLEPDPILTVSEWADSHRQLSTVASAEAGPWRTARTPYLKEIMDCLSVMSPVEEVVFMKGAQIGGTEAGNNWIGYVIDQAPGPMMAVQPTVDLAKRNSKTRIKTLIDESPRLKQKVKNTRSRDGGNTLLAKEFPGGILVMAGANSAVALRSMPVRCLMLDEIDGYPDDVDGEGDPVSLAEARTRTFSRKKKYKVSTPTFEGRSKIQAAYNESDRRRYFVPCPHCKGIQWLKWAQVTWPESKPLEAYYVCELCSEPIAEHHKTWMLDNGRWIAENPGAGGGKVAGFHLSALYSPWGWYSWGQAARDLVAAKDKPELLRGFINTVLGETWKDRGDAPDWQRLYDRRESYELGYVDYRVLFLTAGVDVQKDRIEVEVVGWARDKQSWSVEYHVFAGDTATDVPWKELDQLLEKTWKHPCGPELAIRMLAVDSGFNTQHVYNWARRYPMNRVMAIKGSDQAALLLGQPSAVDVNTGGRKIKRGMRLWPVGVGVAKGELYSWLKLDKPVDGQEFPRGFCHFPQYSDEYFKQLTAEQLVVRIVKGHRKYDWEKTRDRNEALDCRIYARAAASAVGLDRFTSAIWDQFSKGVGIPLNLTPPTAQASTEARPVSEESTATRETPKRRRSSFWDGRRD